MGVGVRVERSGWIADEVGGETRQRECHVEARPSGSEAKTNDGEEAPSEERPQAMTQWEYKVVTYNVRHDKDCVVLNGVGDEGWEVFFVDRGEIVGTMYLLWMKRPKQAVENEEGREVS